MSKTDKQFIAIWEKDKDNTIKTVKEQNKKKQQMKGKYGSPTAIRLREKLAGENRYEEMKADSFKVFKNQYNACRSEYGKRSLFKNHYHDCFDP